MKKQIKKKYIFLFVILGLILLLLIILVTRKKVTVEPQITPNQISTKNEDIFFRVDPPEGDVAIGGSKIGISVFFNQEVDPSSLFIITTPYINLEPKTLPDFPQRIILEPQDFWIPGQNYTITIKSGIKSLDGSTSTKEDIVLDYIILEVEPFLEEFHPLL